ncbi:uncharacterized protein MAM_08292 [Metarhizium album ARSEF 1941]|uniref:Uncharacterized protein n=1 Tax=Metarhizium album (strain ARSEF 1941) TaxID=1081103 RepID=A0A0B2WLH3_METAS|nr:uncharacterized protein MAM_08292 [Metarhizium album ARSEF 1941]KHN93870.1 hypothetical protein MAM_08292 [Metarhizium album ARSEF 1941]
MDKATHNTGAVIQVNSPNKENNLPDAFTFIQHVQQSPMADVGLPKSHHVRANVGPVTFDGYILPEKDTLMGVLYLLNIQLGKVSGSIERGVKATARLASATGDVVFFKQDKEVWMKIDISVIGAPWKMEQAIWPPKHHK